MNNQSSYQIFNYDPRISSPPYHFTKEFYQRSLNNSPSSHKMTQSMHLTLNSSKLFDASKNYNYNSLKIDKNKKNLTKKDTTLSRQRSMNNYLMQQNFPGHDRKRMESDPKHEQCLNWLESGSSYEQDSKELDANIQLLLWKKRHLEIIKKQKTKEKPGIQKLQDSSTTTTSDSPPPLSDFFKPDLSSVSADDGFESAVDAMNNQANLQHICYLEGELKRRDVKIQMYHELMAKKELKTTYHTDLGFLTPQRTSFDPSSFSNYNNSNNTLDSSFQSLRVSPKTFGNPQEKSYFNNPHLSKYKTSTPTSKTPVRPSSFTTQLLPRHSSDFTGPSTTPSSSRQDINTSFHTQDINQGSFVQGINSDLNSNKQDITSQLNKDGARGPMELLKLKSELLVKEQHLRKMRGALKELSARYNELLEEHLKVVRSNDTSRRSELNSPSPFSQDGLPFNNNGRLQRSGFIDDLNDVMEQLHRIVNHKRLVSASQDQLFTPGDSQRTSTDKELSMLHQSIKELRCKLLSNQSPPRHHHRY